MSSMDFSDYEEVDGSSSDSDDGRDSRDQAPNEDLSETMRENFSFPQSIQLPLQAHLLGGHPPWQGHGGKLIGVVDMGR